MKKVVFLVALAALAVGAVTYFKKTDMAAFETLCTERVGKVFTGLIEGPGADEEMSTAQWMYGRNKGIGREDSDNFYDWLRKKGLTIKVKEYELVSATLVDGEDTVNRHVVVRCKVNGRPQTLIVRHKMPLEWAD